MPKPKNIVVTCAAFILLAACGGPSEAPPGQKASMRAAQRTAPAANTAEQKIYTLVILGDSLSAGQGLQTDEAFPAIMQRALDHSVKSPIRIINAGVSGDTSASGLARFDWSVGPKADGVLIALGANDMLGGLDPALTRANLTAMIEKAQARKLDVYLAGMQAAPSLGADYQARFDGLYTDIAKQYCVALYPFLLAPLASKDGTHIDQSLIQRDGLHPTKEGAAKIGHALARWLEPQLNHAQTPCNRTK